MASRGWLIGGKVQGWGASGAAGWAGVLRPPTPGCHRVLPYRVQADLLERVGPLRAPPAPNAVQPAATEQAGERATIETPVGLHTRACESEKLWT